MQTIMNRFPAPPPPFSEILDPPVKCAIHTDPLYEIPLEFNLILPIDRLGLLCDDPSFTLINVFLSPHHHLALHPN